MVEGTGDSRASVEEALQQQIQEKALLLSELDMMIMDYQRERQDLLKEIRQLQESLWKLRDREGSRFHRCSDNVSG